MEIKPLVQSQAACSDCFKQFALHTGPEIRDDEWLSERLGDRYLSRSRSLPRLRVRKEGQTLAILIGWVVYGGRFYTDGGELELDATTSVADLYRELCGRFVLIAISATGDLSIRVDASGQLPVVYDERAGSVASTPTALAKFRDLDVDTEVVASAYRNDGKTWFPFGLVPYTGVRRLLPEQVLELSSGTVSRVPFAREERSSDRSAVVATILDIVSSSIKAIAASGPVRAHLTAGVDSRMVLAASLRADARVALTTVRGNDGGNRLDDYMARKIAKACGLPHFSIPVLKPSIEEMDAWHRRAGYCIDDAVVGLCRTVREGYDDSTVLTGTCGEIGRAFFWGATDIDEVGLDPGDLVERLGFGPSRELISRAASWVDEVGASRNRAELLDLAYIQQRLAGWAGPAVYGHAIPKPTISPFNSQRIYDRVLSLPEDFRSSGSLSRDFIRAAQPELLRFPFNQATGWSRLMFPKQELRRVVPSGLKRRFRRMLRGGA